MDEKLRKVFDKCLSITGGFEGAKWNGSTGNFDGAGISCFILQWNLGQRTLQPLLFGMYKAKPSLFKSSATDQMDYLVQVITSNSRKTEQSFVSQVTTGRMFEPPPNAKEGRYFEGGKFIKGEWAVIFQRLGENFKEEQREAAIKYFDAALRMVNKFELKTERAIAFMFDQAVQRGNRSIEDEFEQFVVARRNGIENQPIYKEQFNPESGVVPREIFWMKYILDNDLPDFTERWRDDVKGRRTLIIDGKGHARGRDWDMEKEFGLTDEIVLQ